ncbi:MAG: hypothetical protein ABIO44_06745 [Saprospiraceae bacterium]
MMVLPKEFIIKCEPIFQGEIQDFIDSFQTKCRPSIRINSNKTTHTLELSDPVPWCNHAYYLNQRPVFTLDPYFHAGHYYPQEASSMILEEIVKKLILPFNAKVLDLCAAPGGKSTHLLDLLSPQSFLHCHETIYSRAEILRQNIEKWGHSNTLVSSGSIQNIINSGITYDLILIDAPCSGEGMFRKENDALKQWSPNKVNYCTLLQNEITSYAAKLLNQNGYIIYSTCTFNLEENENIISKIISNNNFQSVELDLNPNYGLLSTHHNSIHTYRCAPHRLEGEGFSFSVLRNSSQTSSNNKQIYKSRSSKIAAFNVTEFTDSKEAFVKAEINNILYAIPELQYEYFEALKESGLRVLSAGIPLGHLKGKDWFPEHGLAQNLSLSKNFMTINLNLIEAQHYLRADNSYLPLSQNNAIWQIISYEDAKLGWVKNIGQKLKNYLPKNQRIHSL